jgi:hypothetical protein
MTEHKPLLLSLMETGWLTLALLCLAYLLNLYHKKPALQRIKWRRESCQGSKMAAMVSLLNCGRNLREALFVSCSGGIGLRPLTIVAREPLLSLK